jgi:hypothetical protein
MTAQSGGDQSELDARIAAEAYANDMATLDIIATGLADTMVGADEKLRQAVLAQNTILRHLLKVTKHTVKETLKD